MGSDVRNYAYFGWVLVGLSLLCGEIRLSGSGARRNHDAKNSEPCSISRRYKHSAGAHG